MLATLKDTGALTPRRADKIAEDIFEGELGPKPQGIDMDIPMNIQFAQIQNAQNLKNAGNESNDSSNDSNDDANNDSDDKSEEDKN